MKTEDEKQEEERAYVEWLKGEKERLESAETRNMVQYYEVVTNKQNALNHFV